MKLIGTNLHRYNYLSLTVFNIVNDNLLWLYISLNGQKNRNPIKEKNLFTEKGYKAKIII